MSVLNCRGMLRRTYVFCAVGGRPGVWMTFVQNKIPKVGQQHQLQIQFSKRVCLTTVILAPGACVMSCGFQRMYDDRPSRGV